jgi:hypothetical protein
MVSRYAIYFGTSSRSRFRLENGKPPINADEHRYFRSLPGFFLVTQCLLGSRRLTRKKVAGALARWASKNFLIAENAERAEVGKKRQSQS